MFEFEETEATHLIAKIMEAGDISTIFSSCVQGLGKLLKADRILIVPPPGIEDEGPLFHSMEWSENSSCDDVSLLPVIEWLENQYHRDVQDSTLGVTHVSDVENAYEVAEIREALLACGGNSILFGFASKNSSAHALIAILRSSTSKDWRDAELFSTLLFFLGIAIDNYKIVREREDLGLSYLDFVARAKPVFIMLDPDLKIVSASDAGRERLGLTSANEGEEGLFFYEFMPESQRGILMDFLQEDTFSSVYELNLMLTSKKTGLSSWIIGRILPLVSAEGHLDGWELVGVDDTYRRELTQSLQTQQRTTSTICRLMMLFDQQDVSNLREESLSIMCEGLKADAAIWFKLSPDGELFLPNLSIGLEEEEYSLIRAVKVKEDPISSMLQSSEARIVNNGKIPGDIEGVLERFASGILSSGSIESFEPRGLFLFLRISDTSFNIGEVACARIGALEIESAIEQKSIIENNLKLSQEMGVLLKVRRELSFPRLREGNFVKYVLSILSREMNFKRIWLGLLNESGTSIVSHAGVGKGLRGKLVNLSVDILRSGDPLSLVVKEKRIITCENPGELLLGRHVKPVTSEFWKGETVFMPIVVQGEVIGVLGIQSQNGKQFLGRDGKFLKQIIDELGNAILAKRNDAFIARTEKMRIAGHLIAGFAHNFNNILQAITGQASLVEMNVEDEDLVKIASQDIQEESSKAVKLLEELLFLSDQVVVNKEIFYLEDLFESLKSSLESRLVEGRELSIDECNDLPPVFVSREHITTIICNLVSNCSESIRDLGKIRIFFEVMDCEKNSILQGLNPGRYVVIYIEDNGPGMSSLGLERCFDPFFSTADAESNGGISASGSGLDLSIAYALAKKNGGRLSVESQGPKGTMFSLYLPTSVQIVQRLQESSQESTYTVNNDLQESICKEI